MVLSGENCSLGYGGKERRRRALQPGVCRAKNHPYYRYFHSATDPRLLGRGVFEHGRLVGIDSHNWIECETAAETETRNEQKGDEDMVVRWVWAIASGLSGNS